MHKLHIKDITKTIKKTQILHGISIEVKSGEIVGLLGPNGAGKTTTFYTVCGLVKPTSGTVYFDDKDITSLPLHKRALKGIGYLPQESSIFKDLSVEDMQESIKNYKIGNVNSMNANIMTPYANFIDYKEIKGINAYLKELNTK